MKGLSVLSFGFTRGLWEGDHAEDVRRMRDYAAHLDAYVVIANSYKRHRLAPLQLAPNFDAIPTNAFSFADSFFRMIRIGSRVLRERRIALIQAQDPCFTGIVAALLGWRFGVPVNVCVYGPNVVDPHWVASHWSHPLLARIGAWMLRRADGIQVDGKMTARSLIAAGFDPARVHVKPMVPANLDRFLAIERAPREATPRVLFAGRLALQKNLPLLIDAARLLRERGRHFELHIVGDGPEETPLRAHAAKSGFNGELQFRAAVPREEIAEVFAAADVFALSSDYEGYPRVLMEAAAAGLPIVTTAVSGSDEAVENGETGSIVPIGDTAAFAEKLDRLFGDFELRTRMGVAGRQRMRTQLDPATNAPAQLAIWRAVTRATPSSRAPVQNLLLFNLVTDTRDPILGFTTQWIRELAARVEHVEVLTMCAGTIDVPANVRVHSAGRERGWSEPRRAIEFYRLLFRILRSLRIDGCFSHMMPIFSALAGPVLRTHGIPLVTWYAHPSLTPTLKLAHFASHRMVTSLPNAYPYRRDKLSVIGQGIDTTHCAPDPRTKPADDLILCVSRLSRVKNHPTLLRSFARLPARFRLAILGATAGADDEKYAAELRALAEELAIADRVTFEPPVAPMELPAHYRRCAVHVNLTPAGFGDKVAWEAMACGRPCLVANDDFRETLGQHSDELLFRGNDGADLAAKLTALLAMEPATRDAIGLYLRSQVERLHSLPRLADRILSELAAV